MFFHNSKNDFRNFVKTKAYSKKQNKILILKILDVFDGCLPEMPCYI